MKIFKSGRGKWILIIGFVIILLGIPLSYVSTQDFASYPAYVVRYEDERTKKYSPIIRETVTKELGVAPKDIVFDVTPKTKELTSATVKFSNKDIKDHPFLDSDYFFAQDDQGNVPTEPEFKIILNDNWPKIANISDIISAKVNAVPTQVFFRLVKPQPSTQYLVQPNGKKVQTRKLNQWALTQKQKKIFLQNYKGLSQLEGQGLAKELLKLKLVRQENFNKKVDKEQSAKNLNDIVLHKNFYLKNLKMISSYDPKHELKVGSIRPFGVARSDDNDDYLERAELKIYDTSQSINIIENHENAYKLHDVVKVGSGVYHGWMEPYQRTDDFTFEVEIHFDFDAKDFE